MSDKEWINDIAVIVVKKGEDGKRKQFIKVSQDVNLKKGDRIIMQDRETKVNNFKTLSEAEKEQKLANFTEWGYKYFLSRAPRD